MGVTTTKHNRGQELSPDLDAGENGVAVEVPVTRPFEGYTYLRKEWIDQEDGIEKVTFNMTLGPVNLPADWSRTQTFVMMPEWGTSPLRRTWIVRLPTHLEGHDQYLFHYFFQTYHTNGEERVSSMFAQLIQPREIEYVDYGGELVNVRLHWSIGDWSYAQDTELEAEGIEWGSEFSVSSAPYRTKDRLYQNGRILVMRRLPVPRRFHGLIWAPKGAEIRFCFQLVRHRPEGQDLLWDNNFGKNYSLTI